MDDEELEKIKENLKKAEFNNDEEDLEEMDEEFRSVDSVSFHEKKKKEDDAEQEELEEIKEYEKPRKEDSFDEKKGSNKATIILCVIIAILLIIICILFIPKLFSNSSGGKGKGGNESYDDEGKITNPIIDVSKGKSSFINDNYLYVNYKDAAYITKLDGTVVYQDDDKACSMMSDSYFMCERSDNSKTKYVIKKLNDSGTSENIVQEEDFDSDDRIVRSGNKLVGYYSQNNDGTHMAILNNGSIKEIDMNNLYLLKSSDSMTRKIYGARYAIVSDDKNNNVNDSKKYSYGLYDVIDNKTLINPKYDAMVYLFDDLFIAVKNGKSGIVNTNDSIKVDFKYDAIEYANGLYFVGSGDTVRVLDKTYKTIGDPIKVKSLSNYKYYSKNTLDAKSCGDMVILSKNESNKYAVVDKLGKSKDYDFQNYEVIGNRVVTLKDKSLVLYDTSFNKIQEFTVPNEINIDLDTAVIYVEDNLVFNGCYVFDINSGKYLYQMNNLSRSYQGYFVDLHFKNGIGKADISLDDKPIGSIEDIDISEFLKAENNGIRVTNENFIFHVADKTLIIKR